MSRMDENGRWHRVYQGDSIPSLAVDYGFFEETIWDHGNNAELKALRKDMNILMPGDEVFIPEKRQKEYAGETEQKHTFVRRGVPSVFRLQLLAMGEPRSDEEFLLDIDGKLYSGVTDGDGRLEIRIPGDATGGKLVLTATGEEYPVKIGRLNPVDELSGVQQRLNNLGFNAGGDSGRESEDTTKALMEFQKTHGLDETGEVDGATKAKLVSIHP